MYFILRSYIIRSRQILFMSVLSSNEIEKYLQFINRFLSALYIYFRVSSILPVIGHRDSGLFRESFTASCYFSPKQLHTSVVKFKKKFPLSIERHCLLKANRTVYDALLKGNDNFSLLNGKLLYFNTSVSSIIILKTIKLLIAIKLINLN